jgi:predicted DNA-binding protein
MCLHFCHVSHTLAIRRTEELREWLKDRSRRTGLPVGRLIREKLETAKASDGNRRFEDLEGVFNGPPDLSSRKWYWRK